MNDVLEQRLAAKKRDLENQQEYFRIDMKNIEQSNYEDNAINTLLYMKKLKTEIAELELVMQLQQIIISYHSGKHLIRSDKMQVNIFKQWAAFPAAFSFCHIQNQQRIRAYLTKSPKTRKQTVKLFLNFYKQRQVQL